MRLERVDTMTISQKIDYFYTDLSLKENFWNDINLIKQRVKEIFITNYGNYLFICHVYLDCWF